MKKSGESLCELWGPLKEKNRCIIGVPEVREGEEWEKAYLKK